MLKIQHGFMHQQKSNVSAATLSTIPRQARLGKHMKTLKHNKHAVPHHLANSHTNATAAVTDKQVKA